MGNNMGIDSIRLIAMGVMSTYLICFIYVRFLDFLDIQNKYVKLLDRSLAALFAISMGANLYILYKVAALG